MSIPGAGTDDSIEVGEIHDVPVRLSIWFFVMGMFVVSLGDTVRAGFGWFMVVSVSVLWHELGHAYFAKRYGLDPVVVLHGLGGHCAYQAGGTRREHIAIAAGGPGAGLLLGAMSVAGWWALPADAPPGLHLLLYQMIWVNVFWSLFNLLPILPMDGGRLHELFWTPRLSSAAATLRAHRVSVALGGLLATLAVWIGDLWIGLLLGYFVYGSVQFLRMAKAPFVDWSRATGAHPAATRQRWRDVDAAQISLGMMGAALVGEVAWFGVMAAMGGGWTLGMNSHVVLGSASVGLASLLFWRVAWDLVDSPVGRAAALVLAGWCVLAVVEGGLLTALLPPIGVTPLVGLLSTSAAKLANIYELTCVLAAGVWLGPMLASWSPRLDWRLVAVLQVVLLAAGGLLVQMSLG